MRRSGHSGGYSMILVLCVMALVIALSLALLLTASSVLTSAQNELSQEQSRILALSLSETLEQRLTSSDYVFTSQADEDAAAAADPGDIWFYFKRQMTDPTEAWPYYNDDQRGHTARYAWKTFTLDPEQIPDAVSDSIRGIQDTEMVIYWDSESWPLAEGTVLHVEVTCNVNGQQCTVRSLYGLTLNPHSTVDPVTGDISMYYEWKWNLNWRE